MLSKLATSCQNGQFRTSRHIIRLMVELMAPTPEDTIIDPAFMRKSNVSRHIEWNSLEQLGSAA
ncbi:N-6 DNA methylase [Frigoribacterium sp. UYMn621]|uniref:N-6 DNA methylase n=1 Tax=Frigoribacterium sp. UYMn621 TaxID=3156343 RepID=UPI003394E634